MTKCVGKEAEVETTPGPEADAEPGAETEKSGYSGILVVLLLVSALGFGALYYFKKVKNKPKTKSNTNLYDYDYGDEDEKFESEDTPELDAPETTSQEDEDE